MRIWQELERRRPEARMALGLDRIRAALHAWAGPDNAAPAVLVAGTNGKGSTATFLAHLLGRTGRRVGLFTSPHLWHPGERIRIAGIPLDEERLDAYLGRALSDFPDLTYFELFALAAWQAFADAEVDAAVLEVGLGGRLDATNAAGRVAATVITSIGLDHTHILGTTEAAVAREKAGILRPGVPLWHGPLGPEALAAVEASAAAVGAPIRPVPAPVEAPHFNGPPSLAQNLGLAAAAAAAIAGEAVPVAAADLAARPLGRWTVLDDDPVKIVDGAHNPAGAASLVPAIDRSFDRPPELWLRLGATKDAAGVVAALAGHVRGVVLVDGGGEAWHGAEAVAAHLPVGMPWRSVPAERAAAAFLDAGGPALWIGTLRGLEGFAEAFGARYAP